MKWYIHVNKKLFASENTFFWFVEDNYLFFVKKKSIVLNILLTKTNQISKVTAIFFVGVRKKYHDVGYDVLECDF